jgi:ribosomal protein S18 acetylase RimI-like enzyme
MNLFGKTIPPIDIVAKQTLKDEIGYNFIKDYLTIKFSLEEYLSTHELNQIIATTKEELVGVRMFRILENSIHCSYTAVKVEERGRSINHMMLLEIEKIAKVHNITKITSSARISNYPSNRSLKKSGFILDDEKISDYPDGETKLHYYKFLN